MIIFIYKKNSSIHDYEIESFVDFSLRNNISICIYSSSFSSKILFFKEKLQKYNIFLDTYSNTSNFINIYQEHKKKFNILHIDTLQESMLWEVLNIKSQLGITTSENIHFFQDKSIQRNILSRSNYDKNIYSKVVNLSKNNLDEITKNINYPFIIKPIKWEESFWVDIIKHTQDFDIYKTDFSSKGGHIVEEYIEWKIYSIDYFVDNNSTAFLTPVMREKYAQELWIDDMFIYSCISHDKLNLEFTDNELALYIQETIHVWKIKNSFIHQEFKYTDSWFQTIEVNGRIWGRRLKTLQLWYNINMLDFLIEPQAHDYTCKKSVATFTLYPYKSWKLIWYNEELFEKIKQLPSFTSLKIYPERYIWENLIQTKNGQWNIGVIFLSHENNEIFQKDYNFIESQYKQLLIIE